MNNTIAVIASGESAVDAITYVKKFACITINLSFRLHPDAEYLYAADNGFWLMYPDARKFSGIKYAPDIRAKSYLPAINIVEIKKHDGRVVNVMQDTPGIIGGGGNSGFQAVNLAVHLNATRIILVGFDYKGDHWHEDHCTALGNPTDPLMRKWASRLDENAALLQSWGVEVLNTSPLSRLKNFRKLTVQELKEL